MRHAVELVDTVLREPALVFGSVPPAARDLDLLLRDGSIEEVAAALEAVGFVRKGDELALFRDCTAYAVELCSGADWRLPPGELEALFAEARPVEGTSRLLQPSPHHVLLVLARRFACGLGRLGDKHLRRAAVIPEESWAAARTRAAAWGVERELVTLERAVRGDEPLPRRPRRPRLGSVITLSGLDGSGKSSQARALRDALEQLGYDAVTAWAPLGSNPSLGVLSAGVRRTLRALGRAGRLQGVHRATSFRGSIVATLGTAGDEAVGVPGGLAFAWITFVALLNLATHIRRTAVHVGAGRVVIYDRYTLDSIVRLRTLYGGRPVRFPVALLRRLSPRPRVSFLLAVRPEEAYARKQDRWSPEQLAEQAALYRNEAARLGVVEVDGEQPREVLCARIASEVWRRV